MNNYSLFATDDLRSLYPRFPPYGFLSTLQRLSLHSFLNTEIVVNLELFATFLCIFSSPSILVGLLLFAVCYCCFSFSEVEGMTIGGTKEPKPHKKLEM